MPSIPEIRKALTAAGAMAAAAISAGLITGNLAVWVTGIIATLLAGVGVYITPNDPPK